MANKVEIISSKKISKHLVKDPKVQDAVRDQAKKIARIAEGFLAVHRDTGAHSVKYEGHVSSVKYGHIDHYVIMDGPAPISVEFGHHTKNGRWVSGLYIMTRAMIAP